MPEKRPTLVITGATGFIGHHLASYFAAHDWHVIALIRKAPEKHYRNILYSTYDLSSSENAIIPDTVDAFIHAGYIKQENGNDAFRLNTQSAVSLLKVMQAKNVRQNLFLSSLSADEHALSIYGKQKAAIEKLFLEANGTVVRAGLVLGDGGLFASMKTYLQNKKLIPLFGKGNQPVQTIYIDDLVESIFKIISENQQGQFILATEECVPYKEFYSQLAQTFHVKPKFMRVPFRFAQMGISIGNLLGMKLPVTKDNLLGLKKMKHISSATDLKKLGIQLRSYKESLALLGASPQRRKDAKDR